MTVTLIWSGVASLSGVLTVVVLSRLRRDPLRRLRFHPVSEEEWNRAPAFTRASSSLERAQEIMTEIRGLLPFFDGVTLDLHHPFFFLSRDRRNLLLQGVTAPTINCGTYAQLLVHRLELEGIRTRVVLAHLPDLSEGHVTVEGYFPGLGGWILLDPTFDAVLRDDEGHLLGATGARTMIREGRTVEVLQGPAGGQDAETTSREKLLGYLNQGILAHLAAMPGSALLSADRAPLFAPVTVLHDGGQAWWGPTARLRVIAAGLLLAFLLAAALLLSRVIP